MAHQTGFVFEEFSTNAGDDTSTEFVASECKNKISAKVQELKDASNYPKDRISISITITHSEE